ncbi:MAG: UDP-N-acetylmuramoyl-L-alanyl-D-glutamate--2,6-diaminopimelate ligase [Actinomycetaceae bacterium]|nr:UDP-N-acetylmuramoyl-L-alanyl-D-glutamate--2,6-diaminopimelate ligase [Arcanobacterium sp.]MDD7686828.1 UDP-N-acetylmuramoyl-L-alanyl-D-glutamate--2,6-diaminopimelate ligase [Actinomycetaceae bacterium]MDY5273589.1 UDP-N-acetylmuramoyl-L-alanyl-D-glutamate--2,6-diaminopimelate ligase [Arcanobacterium sp.]
MAELAIAEQHTVHEYLQALRTAGILTHSYVDEVTASLPISCLSYDSREIEGTALFIVKGAHFEPRFLRAAIAQGAVAYVAERALENVLTPAIIVSDIRLAIVVLGRLFYNQVTDDLLTVGITGTKGKSTTAYFVRDIMRRWLASSGKPGPALLSSIKNFDGGEEEESHLTTPEVLDLYRHFARAKAAGIKHVVMEVSSQALKYGRVRDMRFAVAAFTNISEDHISPIEHSDFEDYYTSKLKIFDAADVAVINADADLAERTISYARERCRVVTYGSREGADVLCPSESIQHTSEGTHFTVRCSAYGTSTWTITMPGLFNVSNALCAIAICEQLGVPEEFVRSGLIAARVPGRMELFHSGDKSVAVIVDYAHNKLSYEALFDSLAHEYPNWPIIAVFGSTGGKALDRRVDLPSVASRYCAHIYITEEDNYSEPFASIAADIAAHTSVPYTIDDDREACIRAAIMDWPGRHVVALLGKGVETTRARGTQYVHMPTDAEYALRFLDEYDTAHKLM